MTSTRRDYFWNTLGVLLQNAISPILLIVVTRINGVIDSGLFSYAMSIALIFWAFGVWGGRTYQVSDLKREYPDHSYVTARLLLGVGMIVGSFAFAALNGYDSFKTCVIMAFVVFKMTESIADAIYGILQVNDRLFIAGRSLALKALIGVLIFILVDIFTRDLLWSALGLIAINTIIFIFYDLHYARLVGYSFGGLVQEFREYARKALQIIKRCAPIAAVIFLSMFSLNIPRYYLDRYHALELGYFGILTLPITALALLITFLLQPNIIHLTELFIAKKYKTFNASIRKIAYIIIGAGAGGLLLAYPLGVPVLDFVFGTPFESHKLALLIIIAGAIANGLVVLYTNVFTIVRHFKALFYTLVVTNIGLAVVSIPVVKQYDLLGAVSLFAVVNFVQLAILVYAYRSTIKRYESGASA